MPQDREEYPQAGTADIAETLAVENHPPTLAAHQRLEPLFQLGRCGDIQAAGETVDRNIPGERHGDFHGSNVNAALQKSS
jgi:hypothetical protein